MSNLPDVAPVALDNLKQTAWFARLVVATTPAQAAALVVELGESTELAVDPVLVWPGGADAAWASTAGCAPDAETLYLVDNALRAPDGMAHADGLTAVRLLPGERVTLLLQLPDGVSARSLLDGLGTRLPLVLQRLSHALRGERPTDLQRQLERAEQMQCALFASADLAGSTLELGQLLHGVHRVIGTLLDAHDFLVVHLEPAQAMVRVLYHAGGTPAECAPIALAKAMESLQGSAVWRVLTEGRPLLGTDAQSIVTPHAGPVAADVPGAAWLGVPMRGDGRVQGAVLVQKRGDPAAYEAEDRQLLEFVANHVLLALERKQSEKELALRASAQARELVENDRRLRREVHEQQRARQLQGALLQLADLAAAGIDDGAFYARVHAVVGGLLDARNFSIALQSGDGARLDFEYCVVAGVCQVGTRLHGNGLHEYVLRRAQPVLLQRAQIEALLAAGEIDASVSRRTTSWLGALLCHEAAIVGVVAVRSGDDGVVYDEADEKLLAMLAPQIANSMFRRRSVNALRDANAQLEHQIGLRRRELRQQYTRRTQVQRQLEYQLQHDRLTALPNHWALRARLDQVLESMRDVPGGSCALLHLDIDRFKVINGSLGHQRGDMVLQELAQRVRASVNGEAMVARLFGDEFGVLLESVASPEAAVEAAQGVLEAIRATLPMCGEDLSPSASIGVALADGDGTVAEDLRRNAEVALHHAKSMGRNRIELFDPAWASQAKGLLGMEVRLHHALEDGEFEPYFQPLRRLADGKLVGFEALLRWHHPQLGLLLPHEFLEVAEESGLIETIDWQVFEQSCRRVVEDCPGDTFLTINVSGLHLSRPDFAQRLLALLERTGLGRDRLIIEVTEGTLLGDPEQVRRMLQDLREHGIGAALDDFGTGYSSLSYLHSLPLCLVKIDRTFVQALSGDDHRNSSTVIAAIIALAGALNMQVIAEGIETEAQRDTLTAMGCAIGQGYLLGRPMPKKRWRRLYPRILQGAIGKHLLPLVRAGHGRM